MTGLSRYHAPRGTTLCESAAGELYLSSEADAVISELRSQLDAALAALKAPGVVFGAPAADGDGREG